MKVALDSNVVIDIVNGLHPQVRDRFRGARRAGLQIFVPPPALFETLYGALISARPLHQSEAISAIVLSLASEPLTMEDVHASARIRAERRRAGRPLEGLDALIAGQAVARGWTLVTADTKDFALIAGLNCINWRTSPEAP